SPTHSRSSREHPRSRRAQVSSGERRDGERNSRNRVLSRGRDMTKRLNSIALLLLTLPTTLSVKREEGQTLAEYALILALIAVAVAVVVGLLGGQIKSIFSKI